MGPSRLHRVFHCRRGACQRRSSIIIGATYHPVVAFPVASCDACTETGQRCCSVQPMMRVMRPCSKQQATRPPPHHRPPNSPPDLCCPAWWTDMHCLTDHCGHHAIKSRDVVVGLNRVRLLLRPSCLFHHPHHPHHCGHRSCLCVFARPLCIAHRSAGHQTRPSHSAKASPASQRASQGKRHPFVFHAQRKS